MTSSRPAHTETIEEMSQLVRVQNFSVSMDGFGAGEGQSLEAPFGHAQGRGGDEPSLPADLASWMFATASFPHRSEPGGSRGLDDYFASDFSHNIGAEIMGRNKFGPKRGPWENLDWTGGGAPRRRSCVGRHHVPLPRRQPKRCVRPRRPAAGWTSASAGAWRPCGSSSRPISSTVVGLATFSDPTLTVPGRASAIDSCPQRRRRPTALGSEPPPPWYPIRLRSWRARQTGTSPMRAVVADRGVL